MSDTTTPVPHPAKFSDPIIEHLQGLMDAYEVTGMVLDPFAGIGKVHALTSDEFQRLTIGVELEAEWANQHLQTICGDSRDLEALGFEPGMVDAIVTSPAYGNRMADHHEARDDSKRHTYRHYLGRMPSEGSTAVLQWGAEYRELHRAIWGECLKVLKPGGLLFLNVSDHIRKGKVQKVSAWHKGVLRGLGIEWLEVEQIATRRQRHGANGEVRVVGEWVMVGRKVEGGDGG